MSEKDIQCESCRFLRADIKNFTDLGELSAKFGKFTSPLRR